MTYENALIYKPVLNSKIVTNVNLKSMFAIFKILNKCANVKTLKSAGGTIRLAAAAKKDFTSYLCIQIG